MFLGADGLAPWLLVDDGLALVGAAVDRLLTDAATHPAGGPREVTAATAVPAA